jgi:hypothetical protein
MEVVDWSLEMLRPFIRRLGRFDQTEEVGDPRIRARRIVDKLLQSVSDRDLGEG